MVRFYLKQLERKPDPEPAAVNTRLAIGVGILLWGIGLFALLVTPEELVPEKALWLSTCVVGIGLGVFGLITQGRR